MVIPFRGLRCYTVAETGTVTVVYSTETTLVIFFFQDYAMGTLILAYCIHITSHFFPVEPQYSSTSIVMYIYDCISLQETPSHLYHHSKQQTRQEVPPLDSSA